MFKLSDFILLKMFNELKRQRVHLFVLVISQWVFSVCGGA